MPFAAALSEHPLATHAVGEVVGAVLERLQGPPDLAVLFVGLPHVGATEDIAAAVRRLLEPRALIGCTASTVAGGRREAEDTPALALWAGRFGAAVPFRLTADGRGVTGFPDPGTLPDDARAALVLADPFSFSADDFLGDLRGRLGLDLPVIGGLASAARGPGGNRLLLDDRILSDGAVGVVLAGVDVTTVVSQGCRPIGEPLIVTRAEGRLIGELAGRPALQRLEEMVRSLGPEELALARQGLHLGRVIDESKADFDRGDFLIRSVLGADPDAGAVAVGDEVAVGDTVQFQVRDAASAAEDLHHLLATETADAALLFTCTGRGTHLFGVPNHDATVLDTALDGAPIAGMSCAGEIGPVGGRSFLHGFTASIALFREST